MSQQNQGRQQSSHGSRQHQTPSPVPSRNDPVHRNPVPPGFVASRVLLLQSRTQSMSNNTSAMPTQLPVHEHDFSRVGSQTGFGRRPTNRFGQPAIQNTTPALDQATPHETHTFIGLATPRKHHDEDHAVANPSFGSIRSTNTRTRSKPDREESENNALSFVTTSTIRRQSVRDLFADYGIDRPSGLVSKSASREEEIQPGKEELDGRCHLCLWPHTINNTRCWRCGHARCWKCTREAVQPRQGRRASQPEKRFEAMRPDLQPTSSRAIEEDPVKHIPKKAIPVPVQARLSFSSTRKPSTIMSRFPDFYEPELRRSSRMTPPPNSTPPLSNSTPPPPKITPPPPKSKPHQPKSTPPPPKSTPPPAKSASGKEPAGPFLTGNQTTTNVKDSPFLVAELQSLHGPIQLFPTSKGADKQRLSTPNSHGSQDMSLLNVTRSVKYHSAPASDNSGSEDVHYQGPGLGHRANRPTASRSSKRQKHQKQEYTDHGYAADTSLADETVLTQTSANQTTEDDQTLNPARQSSGSCPIEWCGPASRSVSRSQYRSSIHPESYRSCVSRPLLNEDDVQQRSELVECRGYPRTGYAPYGRRLEPGLDGQCQHIYDDCQCVACQSTPPNVRCCINPIHPSVVHHHHLSRKESSVRRLVHHFSHSSPSPSMAETDQENKAESSNGTRSLPYHSDLISPYVQNPVTVSCQQRPSKPVVHKRPHMSRNSAFVKRRKSYTQTRPAVMVAPKEDSPDCVDHGVIVGKSKPVVSVVSTGLTDHLKIDKSARSASRISKEHPIFRALTPDTHDHETTFRVKQVGTDGPSSISDSGKEPWSTFPSRKRSSVKEVSSRPLSTCPTISQPKPRRPQLRRVTLLRETESDTLSPFSESQNILEKELEDRSIDEQGGTDGIVNTHRTVEQGSRPASYTGYQNLAERRQMVDTRTTPRDGHLAMDTRRAAEGRQECSSDVYTTHGRMTLDDELAALKRRKIVKSHQEHSLKDDADDATLVEEAGYGSLSGGDYSDYTQSNHNCVWRLRFMNSLANEGANRADDPGFNIRGISLVIHLEGREDLVARANSWEGGGLL